MAKQEWLGVCRILDQIVVKEETMIDKWCVYCVTCMKTLYNMYESRMCDKVAQDHLKEHQEKGVNAKVIVGQFVTERR